MSEAAFSYYPSTLSDTDIGSSGIVTYVVPQYNDDVSMVVFGDRVAADTVEADLPVVVQVLGWGGIAGVIVGLVTSLFVRFPLTEALVPVGAVMFWLGYRLSGVGSKSERE